MDNFFTNISKCEYSVKPNDISDHNTLFLAIPSQSAKVKTNKYYVKRTFSENNILNFINDLPGKTWDIASNCCNLDTSYRAFHEIFQYYLDEHFPLRKHYNSGNSKKSWITEEVKSSSENLVFFEKYYQ